MSKKTLIIIISSVVVAFIAAIVIAWALISANNSKSDSKDSSSVLTAPTSSVSSVVDKDTPVNKGSMGVKNVDAKAGSNVTVPIYINDNPGIAAFQLDFSYDAAALELVSVDDGLFSVMDYNDDNGKLSVISCESKNITKNGNVINLVFKPKKSAKGRYDIKVTKSEVINYDEQTVNASFANGVITVK